MNESYILVEEGKRLKGQEELMMSSVAPGF